MLSWLGTVRIKGDTSGDEYPVHVPSFLFQAPQHKQKKNMPKNYKISLLCNFRHLQTVHNLTFKCKYSENRRILTA